ncbi:hypothetical protein TrRE_jg3597 [Triparma retinervis]|uniref:J domain-containing protein n=1 Tax=Triparma retinervis TaxID=2557542 RepID=A0A9W7G8U7_9STRA|nr:hypothetical protein TrRE_jg3597 [Triparma retinervis]
MAPNLNSKDLYEILGVSRSSSAASIKKAYRKLAVQYHPDKNTSPDATEKFQKISAAFATLSDPAKRRDYDTFGEERPSMGQQMSREQAEKMFSMFFGGSDPFGGGMGGDPFGGMGGMGQRMSFGNMGGMDGMGGMGQRMSFGNMGGMGGGMGGGMFGPGMEGMGGRGGPFNATRANKRQNTSSNSNPFGTMKFGTQVTLRGLSKESMNGTKGTISGWDPKSHRHIFTQGDGSGRNGSAEPVSIKRENLQQHPTVTISGTSQPRLNESSAKVLGYVEDTARYNVRLSNGKAVSLKTSNCMLPAGTVVRLCGLKSAGMNGAWGTLEGREEGKYIVRMEERRMKVRTENVVC